MAKYGFGRTGTFHDLKYSKNGFIYLILKFMMNLRAP